ncbi:hypothetical protein Tco_0394256 [Tanacetum coccineum]
MANLEFYDKHNMVAYLQKFEGSEGFHQIIDFLNASHIQYALQSILIIYVSFIKQFWKTTTARTIANGEVELTATINGKVKTITEASLRRHLKLEDNGGITTLPNSEIFEQLALIGVKKLEQKVKTTKARRRARIVLSKDEEDVEDSSKQGRKISTINKDSTISLVQPEQEMEHDVGIAEETTWFQEDAEIQEKNSADTEILLQEEEPTELMEDHGSGEKGDKEVSTVRAEHSIVIPEVSTTAANLVYIRRSAQKRKYKGKAIMQEFKPPKKVKKRVQVQMSMDEDLAMKVFEEEQAKAMAEQEQERINFEAALELQKQLDKREEVAAEPTQA